MTTSIEVSNLGKCYRSYRNPWLRVLEWFSEDGLKLHREHWVLKDISFQVGQGEALGILGQNGAGKSTLLKILTGTTRPTAGEFQVQGRISALLELGMGFHGEFTGHQNAVMGCQIRGLCPQETRELLPTIKEFSELGDYFEQPLRVYSSGMQMRLAFSVATIVRPDVLIVDEALSVGDGYFCHKCMKRIGQFREAGTTLLFVSHDINAVNSLCDHAILLVDGRIVQHGPTRDVADYYRSMLVAKQCAGGIKRVSAPRPAAAHSPPEASANQPTAAATRDGGVQMMGSQTCLVTEELLESITVQLLNSRGQQTHLFIEGEKAQVSISVQCRSAVPDLHIGFGIRNRRGLVIYEANTYTLGLHIGDVAAGHMVTATFDFEVRLKGGNYSVMVGAASKGYGKAQFEQLIFFEPLMDVFEVLAPADKASSWDGIWNICPEARIRR